MTAPVIPPPAVWLECEDCGDEFDPQEGCQHDGHAWCGSCFVERCPECRADLKDDMAAEAASEGRWA